MTEETKNGTVVSVSAKRAIVDEALSQLPAAASAEERQRAIALARGALRENEGATKPELVQAVNLAVAPVADEIRGRLRREHWRIRAPQLLPYGADDDDKREARQIALELLKEIPVEASDSDVETEIREAVQPLCGDIENERRINTLIAYGRGCLGEILLDLHLEGAITREEWLDSHLRQELEGIVVEELELPGGNYELDGSESNEDVKRMVQEIVADALDLDEIVEDGS